MVIKTGALSLKYFLYNFVFAETSFSILKDTNREKARSNKTPALTKSISSVISVAGPSN